jgi:hypothetical protein
MTYRNSILSRSVSRFAVLSAMLVGPALSGCGAPPEFDDPELDDAEAEAEAEDPAVDDAQGPEPAITSADLNDDAPEFAFTSAALTSSPLGGIKFDTSFKPITGVDSALSAQGRPFAHLIAPKFGKLSTGGFGFIVNRKVYVYEAKQGGQVKSWKAGKLPPSVRILEPGALIRDGKLHTPKDGPVDMRAVGVLHSVYDIYMAQGQKEEALKMVSGLYKKYGTTMGLVPLKAIAVRGGLPAPKELPSPAAQRAGQAAVVEITRGNVRVVFTDGRSARALEGHALMPGDSIIVGRDSRALIRFADGSVVRLQPRSTFCYRCDRPPVPNDTVGIQG